MRNFATLKNAKNSQIFVPKEKLGHLSNFLFVVMRVAENFNKASLLVRFLRHSDKIEPNAATEPNMKTATINGEGEGNISA